MLYYKNVTICMHASRQRRARQCIHCKINCLLHEFHPIPISTCVTLQKCKGYYNLGVVISVASVQRVLYTLMITVYKPHIEILIATFCFQNWWSRTAKALQSWETPNRCNSDNHSNFKMTLTFLQCIVLHYLTTCDC